MSTCRVLYAEILLCRKRKVLSSVPMREILEGRYVVIKGAEGKPFCRTVDIYILSLNQGEELIPGTSARIPTAAGEEPCIQAPTLYKTFVRMFLSESTHPVCLFLHTDVCLESEKGQGM